MNYEKAYGQLHESHKRFPGYSLGAYVGEIALLVDKHRNAAIRLLDYGCGKGFQYLVRRYHDRWGGILPHCYDIGVPQLATKPEGVFTGVICTDVLEHIEKKDLPAILDELIAYTQPGGFLFLGISCRPSRKTLPDGRDVHVTVEPPLWWINLITQCLNKAKRDRASLYVKAMFDNGDPPHFTGDNQITAWDSGAC